MNPVIEAAASLDPGRRRALWHEPRGATLLDVVSMPAERYPELPAVFLSPDGRVSEPLLWSALWAGARDQAGRLAAAGLRAGEPVMLAVPTSATFFTTFFGILAAGGVPVPIATPPSLKPARLGWYGDLLSGVAVDAGARVLVTTTRFCAAIHACAAPLTSPILVLDAEAAAASTTPFEPRSAAPGDLALLQYTSGSTSRPKGVVLTHANVLANAEIIADAIAREDSSCVSWLPLHHDMGLIGAALTGLYARVPILLLPTTVFVKEPATWLRAISAFRATITLAPNFAFVHVVRHAAIEQLAGVSLASLRTALNGAEPVDAAAVEAFEDKFAPLGLRRGVVRPVYGLAESTLAVTFADEGERIVDMVDADRLERDGVAIPAPEAARTRPFVSVGRPLATQELRIADEADRACAERVVGEVTVRGPSVMHGYYNRPEETRAALRGGWLRTGDLGYLAAGRLYLTGRLKDLIIRHGRNYYPPDVEVVIAGTEGVLRGGAVAFGVDEADGARVIVVAETRLRRPADLDALTRRIRERCHDAFLFGPDDVCLAPAGSIPRTTSGKVRRNDCRQLYLTASLPAIVKPDDDMPVLSDER